MNWLDAILKRKPKIGLALSGGATLGAAHVGALQVLEHAGIRPDFVAGTSAGALVGAAYCAGIPLDELDDIFLDMRWPTLIKLTLKKSLSVFDTQPMEEFLVRKLGNIEFKDLKIPFAAIACDLLTGKRVVLESGPLAPALRASAAIPGLFSPVSIDNRLLIDGGVVDSLPVEQVRAMGASYVIGVDVSLRTNYSKPPENPFDVLMIMFNIMQKRTTLVERDRCDCYIQPEVSRFSSFGFADAEKILLEGKIAATRALPELARLRKA